MMSTRLIAAVAAALALTACGGGGGGSNGGMAGGVQSLESDPRMVRLDRIVASTDALLASTSYGEYAITAQGVTVSETVRERMSCTGALCVGDDGSELSFGEIIYTDDDIEITSATIDSRAGLDAAAIRADFDFDDSFEGVTVTSFPDIALWGLWGEYGVASGMLVSGPISGTIEGTRFRGDVSMAVAMAGGDSAGTNPTGMGGATWAGAAEAVRLGDFTRRQGTASVTIPDLSRPSVTVAVDVPGFFRDWSGIPLANGRYESGRQGSDYVAGDFHGPAHEETYGVFDTGAYIGAFGAKRQ